MLSSRADCALWRAARTDKKKKQEPSQGKSQRGHRITSRQLKHFQVHLETTFLAVWYKISNSSKTFEQIRMPTIRSH